MSKAVSQPKNDSKIKCFVVDTNVLIHDPNSILSFQEHLVAIPMVVLEELDKLKTSKQAISAECRQAIRLIESIIEDAPVEQVSKGVPIPRETGGHLGELMIVTRSKHKGDDLSEELSDSLVNDNKIINDALGLRKAADSRFDDRVVLVTKDINMRLKARAVGIEAQDYHTDQLVDDVDHLPKGFHHVPAFWDLVESQEIVNTKPNNPAGPSHLVTLREPIHGLAVNQFILDDNGFVGLVRQIKDDSILLTEYSLDGLLGLEAWGLSPRDIYQALALLALLDPDIHLVNLAGSAGSGKTILALAAAIEQTMVSKRYNKIIVTRSVQGLDEDIGFLPGTEAEKMLPWLGAITDNLEALHDEDESTSGSIDYILQKVPLQFKSLNYIRGRSFQNALIIVDECQNLTPHQMKTIITRAGKGSKVICLGNLAQIDTPYLSAPSSGLTYLTERFKGFKHSVTITLQGVPRSVLAEHAEAVL